MVLLFFELSLFMLAIKLMAFLFIVIYTLSDPDVRKVIIKINSLSLLVEKDKPKTKS